METPAAAMSKPEIHAWSVAELLGAIKGYQIKSGEWYFHGTNFRGKYIFRNARTQETVYV